MDSFRVECFSSRHPAQGGSPFVGEAIEAVEAVHERILELGFASQEHHRRPSVDAELVYWPRDERSPRHLLSPER